MPRLSTTCPGCAARLEPEPTQVHLRAYASDGEISGGVLVACPSCGEVTDRPVDGFALAMLVAAGVRPWWPASTGPTVG